MQVSIRASGGLCRAVVHIKYWPHCGKRRFNRSAFYAERVPIPFETRHEFAQKDCLGSHALVTLRACLENSYPLHRLLWRHWNFGKSSQLKRELLS
jgi:hypothetical protein